MLELAGYEAIGVDPEAPSGSPYRQVEFESWDTAGRLDAVVACTSLHHVADLAQVLDLVHAALVPGGAAVIVEWARERFDEATARWCFDRLPDSQNSSRLDARHDAEGDPGWLHQMRDEWLQSAQPWEAYLSAWGQAEGLHTWQHIQSALEARFDSQPAADGPYFFAELADVTEADEQAAIDGGLVQANRVLYVGRRR
jgi:SAM-dependent methyltransferase